MNLRGVLVILAASAVGSCAERQTTAPLRLEDENAALGGEIAAHVGDTKIPLSLVKSVAQKQQVSPREAARRLVDDAIAAQAARAKGLDARPPAAWLLVAARGRFAADKIFEEARAAGPPNDEELKALSEIYWHVVDRPPSVRVVHAVAQPSKPGAEGLAREVAAEILAAVRDAASEDDFLAKAKAVKVPADVNVVVQPLPAFTEEGWLTEVDGNPMDTVFSKAAHALPSVGATSEIVRTSFGFHVIRLAERIPEQRVPMETRRTMFAEEAAKLRARTSVKNRINTLRTTHPVEIMSSAETLMRSVPIRER